jgi:hypothetical protein
MVLDHRVSQGIDVSDHDGNLPEVCADANPAIWRNAPELVANSDPSTQRIEPLPESISHRIRTTDLEHRGHGQVRGCDRLGPLW